jgi:hypothetical protein
MSGLVSIIFEVIFFFPNGLFDCSCFRREDLRDGDSLFKRSSTCGILSEGDFDLFPLERVGDKVLDLCWSGICRKFSFLHTLAFEFGRRSTCLTSLDLERVVGRLVEFLEWLLYELSS